MSKRDLHKIKLSQARVWQTKGENKGKKLIPVKASLERVKNAADQEYCPSPIFLTQE